jgi:integrase/recombinase XerD
MKCNILLRKRKNSDGEYPIVLSISEKSKTKLITLGLYADLKNWDLKNNKFKSTYKDQNLILEQFKSRADGIILNAKIQNIAISLESFERAFRGRDINSSSNAVDFFYDLLKDQVESNKLGNAKAYKDTIKALTDFGGKNIPFEKITPEFLNKWEVFLRKRGSENGGIAFKMRELRAMINKAVNRNIISVKEYPFKGYKVSRLKQNPNKIALSQEELKRFKSVNLEKHPNLIEAHDYFLFSFYTRGMNFKDMMLLRWSDIKKDRIKYKRSKTGVWFDIQINEPIQMILGKYKENFPKSTYVFPILLNDLMTSLQIEYRKHKVLSRYNKKLKEIAPLAEIESKMTSYVARHSFATILKHNGESIEIISELMGHQSVAVTQAYLKDFDKETLDKAASKLIDI